MDLPCPSCARAVRIPDDQNDQPGHRRAKCVHCRFSFVVPDSVLAAGASANATAGAVPEAFAPAANPGPPPPLRIPTRERMMSRTDASSTAADSRAGVASTVSVLRPPAGVARAPGWWNTCALHPGEPAADVCEPCQVGYCAGCARPMPGGKVCPTCMRPVIPVADKRREVERQGLRPGSLLSEIPRILAYPFRDPVSFGLLAVMVGFFSLARGVSMGVQAAGFSYLFAQGLLMAYAFTALRRVAHGDLSAGMPDLQGLDDLVRPIRLSATAFAVAVLPLVIVLLVTVPIALGFGADRGRPAALARLANPPSAIPLATEDGDPGSDPNAVLQQLADQAQSAPAGGANPADGAPLRPAAEAPSAPLPPLPAWAPFAITLAILWALGYFPVAFMVAAISQSMLTTLDPREGLSAIRAMGVTYWQAVGITSILFLACGVARGAAGLFPVVGLVVGPVLESYQWLSVGCALGLAIFKKADALGFD